MSKYLQHSGRKGMKWYQHIYGKEDSRAQYSKSGSSKNKSNNSNADGSSKQKMVKRPMTREEIMRSPQALYKHRDEFTTEELQKAIQRFRVINDLETIAEGEKAVGSIFDTMNGVSKKTTTGVNMYNQFANIWNTFKPDDKPALRIVPTGGNKKKK